MPAHTGPRLASVSACWLCGHCFFPALLFSAEPVLEGRDLNPQSLHHLHPNAALAMNMSSLSACTAFAKLWGMLSAAPQSVQFQDSVPIPGAMALRSAGGPSILFLSSSPGRWVRPVSGKASSCLERRQGQLITKCPPWMSPALLSGCASSAPVHSSCQSEKETHGAPWPQHKDPQGRSHQ